ncbi:hypothetical protein ACPA5B_26360 [Pseudomonas solani]|uniref:hypothetical protein n=1 Tax=Pseudomonas solani TaxID=2731552 RepID=UPI003C2FABFD
MEKQKVDEGLKGLSFDMDEEIDDRNERQGRSTISSRHASQSMDPSHAIILAAIIIVGGLWGGKFLYDYIQEQRVKEALNEAASYMQQSLQQAGRESQRAQAESQRRMVIEAEAREQRQIQERTQQRAEQARVKQEERFESAQCQFWWQQHEQNPTERTERKKAEACASQ